MMDTMQIPSWILYGICTALAGGTVWYTQSVSSDSIATQNNVYTQLDNSSVQEITIGQSDRPLYISSWEPFVDGNTWTYTSNDSLYEPDFAPTGLVKVPVAHSEPRDMKVSNTIVSPLENLFALADKQGYDLIIASAYRSIDEQQELYDDFTASRGEAAAQEFVATPRGSEHHTGLAIDIDDNSPQCITDSFACTLSPASAAWLAENAPAFGFILRYPEGKKSVTGISAEQWHFRYVGVPLATQLTETGLTFDEFITQVAPGRLKSK